MEDEKKAFTEAKEIFDRMPEVFNVDAAQGLDADFQYEITGDIMLAQRIEQLFPL
jgi:hypothetical protein